MSKKTIVIVGGGAAGVFSAINIAKLHPNYNITIIEKSSEILTKVKISGGGRCNVTHNCFDPHLLIQNYPRGYKELLSAFYQFQVNDMIEWLKNEGVEIKIESDGRIFPITNTSDTIISCFIKLIKQLNINVIKKNYVKEIKILNKNKFEILLSNSNILFADRLLLATGGIHNNSIGFKLAESLGHIIQKTVPSLFTFNIKDDYRIQDLAGISFKESMIEIIGTKLKTKGPLLITHLGMSGPAILKISSWGACILNKENYKFLMKIDFYSQYTTKDMMKKMLLAKETLSKKKIIKNPIKEISKRFWEKILKFLRIDENTLWSDIHISDLNLIINNLKKAIFSIEGKSTNKDEFVTCGGINLKEVNFKTMESKIVPGIFFAGEILNIDGLTGGFNFQAAWTLGWIVSKNI